MKSRQLKSLLLAAVVTVSSISTAFAAVDSQTLDAAVQDTAQYVYETVSDPQVGSVGGEWAVLGLARSGYEVPDSYYQAYYNTVEDYVREHNGVLDERKYTEYSRVTVALTAIGKDPTDVAGYNLLTPLGDYDKTIWQGMNGPIWALIALDSGGYAMPQNGEAETQASRQMYVDRILDCQLDDGGWSLLGGTESATANDSTSDPDITGMALQALAKYQDQAAVKQATEEALACMSEMQDENGGFSSWGDPNSESVVQMIVALCELDIPLDDSRFVKNGNTLLDNLMTYYREGEGFLHTQDGSGSNQMATEQGFYGLVAAQRAEQGKNSLYRMSDAIDIGEDTAGEPSEGLPGKHEDVKKMPVTEAGKTFPDIADHANRTAIEALASRGIITGDTSGSFLPDNNMTRAEFATIVTRALGLAGETGSQFTDVAADRWYAPYIGTAYSYGIVNGTSATTFEPEGTITRQEAATMVARAAKLCGMDTAMDSAAVRDTLAQFTDYVTVSSWAQEPLAFCYQSDILDDSAMEIQPAKAITRCEIAQMLYNMLDSAKLL